MYKIKVVGTLQKRGTGVRSTDVVPFEVEVSCPASLSEQHRLVGLRYRVLHTKFLKEDFTFREVQGLVIEGEELLKDVKPSWQGKKPSELTAEECQEVAAHYDIRGIPLFKRAPLDVVRTRIAEEIGEGAIKYSVLGTEAQEYAAKLDKARRRLANMGARGVGAMSLARLRNEIAKRMDDNFGNKGYSNYEGDTD